ncbi:unnamed protein product, partial [Prorocentrum cordatum]
APWQLLRASAWKTVRKGVWALEEGILVLEARVLVKAMRGLARTRRGACIRQLFLYDDMAVVLAFARSRSHDFKLLVQMRRFNACALALGVAPFFRPDAGPAALSKALPAAEARTRALGKLGPPLPKVRGGRALLEAGSAWPPPPAPLTLVDPAPEGSAGDDAADGVGGLGTSGSDSAGGHAGAAQRRPRVLQASRRRCRAALCVGLIVQSSPEEGALLERLAVMHRMTGRYVKILARFCSRAGLTDEKLAHAKDEQVGCLLYDYFTAMYLAGEQSSLGCQTMAAPPDRQPVFDRRWVQSWPRAWRALRCWRRRASARALRALPLAVRAVRMWRLVDKGLTLTALFLAVDLSAYSRPFSFLAARKCDLVPRSRATVDSWSLLAHQREGGSRGHADRCDDDCQLGLGYTRGRFPLCAHRRAAGGANKPWPLDYLEPSEAALLAAAVGCHPPDRRWLCESCEVRLMPIML